MDSDSDFFHGFFIVALIALLVSLGSMGAPDLAASTARVIPQSLF